MYGQKESEVYILSPKTGRPPIDNPKDKRLYIRVTEKEKQEIMDFTKKNNISCLELLKIGMEKAK